jgi:hypothetical protein
VASKKWGRRGQEVEKRREEGQGMRNELAREERRNKKRRI